MSGLTLVVDALAIYRLTRLVTTDELTQPVRERVDAWASRGRDWEGDPGPEPKLTTLIHCDWCTSVWVAAAVVAARHVAPRVWQPVALVLAGSAVTGIASSTVPA